MAQSSNTNKTEQTQSVDASQLSGVRRYKKGRSFADTLFGRMRYGKDIRTNKWVAIKENRKWFAQNKVSIKGDPVPEDLFKEIEAHKYLMEQEDVPDNILKLLDVVSDDVYIYLILELVDGGDFFSFIQNSHKTIDQLTDEMTDLQRYLNVNHWENRVRPIFNDVVKSISWMHCKNICHLDISLENALIDKNKDMIKIIDFGLAKIITSKDYSVEIDSNKLNKNKKENLNKKLNEKYGKWNDLLIRNQEHVTMGPKRIGKLRCMAPEVFNLQQFNPFKADTWSIAVMLFMMLLGIPPWNSPDESETIFRMIKAGRIRDVIIYNQRRHLISNQALDLLIRLFKPQSERIHLDFVKLHPFSIVFNSNNDNHGNQNG